MKKSTQIIVSLHFVCFLLYKKNVNSDTVSIRFLTKNMWAERETDHRFVGFKFAIAPHSNQKRNFCVRVRVCVLVCVRVLVCVAYLILCVLSFLPIHTSYNT